MYMSKMYQLVLVKYWLKIIQEHIQRSFATGQPEGDPKLFQQIYKS